MEEGNFALLSCNMRVCGSRGGATVHSSTIMKNNFFTINNSYRCEMLISKPWFVSKEILVGIESKECKMQAVDCLYNLCTFLLAFCWDCLSENYLYSGVIHTWWANFLSDRFLLQGCNWQLR